MNIYLETEFDKQIHNLVEKGYPASMGKSAAEFLHLFAPLKNKFRHFDLKEVDLDNGYLPFVIVIKSTLIDANTMMNIVKFSDKAGVSRMRPKEPHDFETLPKIDVPDSDVYLLVDIDRGKDTLNVVPSAAKVSILAAGRSPLTIDEGIAIITQYPEFLQKNNCFSLAASRCGDQRVPAIWINAKKEANLGWCWDNNPHTWLGTASCLARV